MIDSRFQPSLVRSTFHFFNAMTARTQVHRLQVATTLHQFIEQQVLPGTSVSRSCCCSTERSRCAGGVLQGVGLKHLTGDVKSMLSRITETDQVGLGGAGGGIRIGVAA